MLWTLLWLSRIKKMTFTAVLLTRVSMDLSMNQLFGDIPMSIDELASMVNLSSNTFSGTIPPSIGIYMSNIQSLDLSNNLLGRKIPQPFATLNQLSILWLLDNNLTGRIHTIAQFQTQGKIAFQLGNPRFCGPSHSKVCKRDSFINVTKTFWHSVIGWHRLLVSSPALDFVLANAMGFPFSFYLFHVLEACCNFLHINNLAKRVGAWHPRT